jgi:hypothetical protein
MEPLDPELKQRLKRAHPGLSDADIETLEELLSERPEIATEKGEARERRNRQWRAFVESKVPRLREIMIEYEQERIRAEPPRPRPLVEIRRKPSPR